jgi:hypothetical protein
MESSIPIFNVGLITPFRKESGANFIVDTLYQQFRESQVSSYIVSHGKP